MARLFREYPIPKFLAFYLFVTVFLYAAYNGLQQATVISAFQLPPEHEAQSLPFSGETVANVLRDSITAIQQEAANRSIPPPCDFKANEEPVGCIGEIKWSPTLYERPNPFKVEVKGLSVEELVSLAREALGRERVITGDIVFSGHDSFQLMARANDGSGPWTVDSQEISLSGLRHASCALAEKILRETDSNVLAAAWIRRGEYSNVIGLYGALHPDAHDFDAVSSLGIALSNVPGKKPQGLVLLRRAVALKRKSAQARSNLGNALGHAWLHDEAISECKKAIDLKPDLPDAHMCLGYALSMKGQWEETIAEYRRATELAPDCPNTHVFLGTALGVRGLRDEANIELKKAIELRPNSADVHTGVGTALQYGGRSVEAIAEYKKALELQPDLLLAHTELGAALLLTQRWDEAIVECRKTIEIKPESPEAHRCLATALIGKEPDPMFSGPPLVEATAELRKAIELDPDYADAHIDLGNVFLFYSAPNRQEEGFSELKKAVELRPSYPWAHYSMGFALNERGRTDEAISELKKAIALQPDFPRARSELAKAEARKGRQNSPQP